jgi:ketosteroid isomerase-like protein
MSNIAFAGGSESDRKRVQEQHLAYLDANARIDWTKLPELWSDAPDATFFNMNGHTYNGREHWTRLWKYYAEHLQSGDWEPFDETGVISGDLAVVWCHRRTKLRWVGTDPRPKDQQHADKDFVSRSTMVYRREDGDWRVVHVHFSEANANPERPGGI